MRTLGTVMTVVCVSFFTFCAVGMLMPSGGYLEHAIPPVASLASIPAALCGRRMFLSHQSVLSPVRRQTKRATSTGTEQGLLWMIGACALLGVVGGAVRFLETGNLLAVGSGLFAGAGLGVFLVFIGMPFWIVFGMPSPSSGLSWGTVSDSDQDNGPCVRAWEWGASSCDNRRTKP
jgi:hypothetical protein